jgi:hypothetical protein
MRRAGDARPAKKQHDDDGKPSQVPEELFQAFGRGHDHVIPTITRVFEIRVHRFTPKENAW